MQCEPITIMLALEEASGKKHIILVFKKDILTEEDVRYRTVKFKS